MKQKILSWVISLLLGAGGATAVAVPVTVNAVNSVEEKIVYVPQETRTLKEEQRLEVIRKLEQSSAVKDAIFQPNMTVEKAGSIFEEFCSDIEWTECDSSFAAGIGQADSIYFIVVYVALSTTVDNEDVVVFAIDGTLYKDGTFVEDQGSVYQEADIEELKDRWNIQ